MLTLSLFVKICHITFRSNFHAESVPMFYHIENIDIIMIQQKIEAIFVPIIEQAIQNNDLNF